MKLPSLNGDTGKDLILLVEQWSDIYFKCAIPHNGLVKALRITLK